MANDDLKSIKELLEVVNNKVGKLDGKVSGLDSKVNKLDAKMNGLKVGIKELDKKADTILEFAELADESAEDTRKRVSKIEKISAIAYALNK